MQERAEDHKQDDAQRRAEALLLAIRELDRQANEEGIAFVHEYLEVLTAALRAERVRGEQAGLMKAAERAMRDFKEDKGIVPFVVWCNRQGEQARRAGEGK